MIRARPLRNGRIRHVEDQGSALPQTWCAVKKLWFRSRGGSVVLVDKSTEAILPHDSAHRRRHRYAAFAAGDLKSLRGLLAPDITWHAPGRNPLAALEEVLTEFIDHYKHARPHQGIGQRRPCEPAEVRPLPTGRVERRNRLAGVLHEYSRAA